MFTLGQRLRLRKKHPCGGTVWTVQKVGVDMRIQCTTCERTLLIPREKLLKQVKEVLE